MRRDLRERVLAAAEADFQPKLGGRRREGGARVAGLVGAQREARQRDIQQAALARAQRMTTRAAIEAVGRRLETVR